jgi:non-heme chloroperoxidase
MKKQTRLYKIAKSIIKTLLISCCVYLFISFVLVYWPISLKKEVKNYDFSSLKKKKPGATKGEKMFYKTRNGSQLFARVYKSQSENVMILIHGSGSESRYLSTLADSIAEANIATVLTPDLRGHGENTEKKGDVDYIGQLENDLEDLILYSKQKMNAKNIILAGHSSGGGFVLRFIGNQKNTKVAKAIMLAPYLGHDAPTVKPNSGGWVTVAMKRIIGLSMLNNVGFSKLNDLPVLFFNRPASINDKLQVPAYSFKMTINFGPKNYIDEIKNIDVPCLNQLINMLKQKLWPIPSI